MVRTSRYALIVVFLGLVGCGTVPATTTAQNCINTVAAARQEWRALSQGRLVAPTQTSETSDGRRFSGSTINYMHVLVGRAEDACKAGRLDQANEYTHEVEIIFHSAVQAF